jgi:hypothetical protein
VTPTDDNADVCNFLFTRITVAFTAIICTVEGPKICVYIMILP